MFKRANIKNLGINIKGEKLSHPRFADELILTTNHLKEAQEMMSKLPLESSKVGLKINIGKTKFITNLVASENIIVNNLNIEKVYSYKSLDHDIRLRRDNQTCEIDRRIGLTWEAFGRLGYILRSHVPMCLKRRVYQCMLPLLTYGAETLTLTKNTANKGRVAQRNMETMLECGSIERIMLKSLRDRVLSTEVRR